METTNLEHGKIYSLFNASGKIEEIKPRPTLPLYCLVHDYSFGMSHRQGAVIEQPNQYGQQKCVSLSEYEPGFFTIDKHSRPLSKKFGIGHYYADDLSTAPEAEVLEAIERSKLFEAEKTEQARLRAEADKKEIAELPAKFPHLTPIQEGARRQATAIDNIRTDLKKHFPKIKFSVRKDGYDSINISWTDGATTDEIKKVTDKYEDHETDWSGDFRDYSPSNFNRVFGGSKYVFERREWSEGVKAKFNSWALEQFGKGQKYGHGYYEQLAFNLFCHNDIYGDFEIIEKDVTGGCYEASTFWTVKPLKAEEATEATAPMEHGKYTLVDYSEKAIALFGDTKPIKDILKAIGGRFNAHLTLDGQKQAGWVFPKGKRAEVEALIN